MRYSFSLGSLSLLCLFNLGLAKVDWLMAGSAVQASPRTTFPGRRVAGATRGECSSRLIVHLVPESSVFAPSDAPLLGLLEGPASELQPLLVQFSLMGVSAPSAQRLLAPGPPALVLLNGPPLSGPTLWQSRYLCGGGSASTDDQLQVVSTSSPPAFSLLVKDVTPQDAGIRERLEGLKGRCGGTVSRAELGAAFGLADLLKDGWPDQLPVRCPS